MELVLLIISHQTGSLGIDDTIMNNIGVELHTHTHTHTHSHLRSNYQLKNIAIRRS